MKKLLPLLIISLTLIILFTPDSASALTILGKDIGCDPTSPPSVAQGGCGIVAFIDLLKVIISYLTVIVVPIAAAMIVWGGIVIMTAAGSAERVGKGKQIITTAIIGVAIALGSWLIINSIYLALTGSNAQEVIDKFQNQ